MSPGVQNQPPLRSASPVPTPTLVASLGALTHPCGISDGTVYGTGLANQIIASPDCSDWFRAIAWPKAQPIRFNPGTFAWGMEEFSYCSPWGTGRRKAWSWQRSSWLYVDCFYYFLWLCTLAFKDPHCIMSDIKVRPRTFFCSKHFWKGLYNYSFGSGWQWMEDWLDMLGNSCWVRSPNLKKNLNGSWMNS